jgi:predicted metal-dependent peptidase
MEASKFQQLKDELFVYISNINYENELTEEFRQKFYRLIELCTFSMMSGGDNFFAQFLIQLKREIKLDLPSALGTSMTKEGFVMYFNPAIFLTCSLPEMQALIKHEIYHIMSSHHIRQKSLKDKYSSLAVN